MNVAGPLDLRFRTALRRMIAAGRVTRVDREVDLELEVGGLMKRPDSERALLFDRVKGSAVPVVGESGDPAQASQDRSPPLGRGWPWSGPGGDSHS